MVDLLGRVGVVHGQLFGVGGGDGLDERGVPLGEGLEGGGGFVAKRDADGGIGAVE